ncbi:MAG: molecular chaperone DnaK, partial [Firmicutes bacterium]|nr:molecular chaperone DnaK [Bacillota bacterium]
SYGFEPEDDEKIYYGIFDFGGGTTDFDFGLWRNSTKRGYFYTIEHFGNGGDRYLGGENLLEMLAFEVFKNNKQKLTENNITFYKPPECNEFVGSEVLLSDSQEARLNTKQLMEKLRCVWENNEEDTETNQMINDGKIKLLLFSNNGKTEANFEIDVNREELNKILYERIEDGVRNFFEALKANFSRNDLGNVSGINIFLAGNSSKSPIVKELFDKYIEKKTMDILSNTGMTTVSEECEFFKVFPPLGTPEAKEIQKEKNIALPEDELMVPTGKTGVAYGLIEGRPSQRIIEVISEIKKDEEIKFRYYLGVPNRKGYFDCIIERNTHYGEWKEFIDAGVNEFEIYFTSLPEGASVDSLPIGKAKKILCRIDETDENANIYIRVVSPDEIEYVAATAEGIEREEYIGEIKKRALS